MAGPSGIASYSVTPATNATFDGGAGNWAENQAPSTVNNTARQQAADMRNFANDLIWFPYGSGDQASGTTYLGVPYVYASATSVTVAGVDVTTAHHFGRRMKFVGALTGTIYGTISSSSFSTNTTIHLVFDSGSLSNETLTGYLSQVPVTGSPVPTSGVHGAAGIYEPVAGGIASAITLTNSPPLAAYATGQVFVFTVPITTALTPTLNVDGLGAVPWTFRGSAQLNAGAYVTGDVVMVEYDGTFLTSIGTPPRSIVSQDFTNLTAGQTTITSTSANALAVGANGTTAPVLKINANVGSPVTGLEIFGNATTGDTLVTAISSDTNTGIQINSKGSGTLKLQTTGTGNITLNRAIIYGGVTLNNAVTGTGNMVLSASPTLSGTVAGALTFSGALTLSSALTYGGVTLNNAVTGTGNMVLSAGPTFTGTLSSANHTITSASANALAVGANGTTNPVLQVDDSTASIATGLKIKGAAAAGGLALSVITSGTNENLTVDAAGSGTITFGGTSTGAIIHTRATTLSAALTYGGVTLSNAVTGTGNMVLSAGPTFTGTLTAATTSFSGHMTIEGVTSTGATGTGKFVFDTSPNITGPVGIGMSPVNVLDITQTQNALSVALLSNASATTAAAAEWALGNGTSNGVFRHNGASFTTSGIFKQDGTTIFCTGAGGITFGTNANQPIYFIVNSAEIAQMTASGVVFSIATSGVVLKRGANGLCGTFVCNGATPVTVNNTNVAITDAIIVSLNTVGGTVGAVPAVKTITASTGFTIAGTASDTSTYNYAIIKNAA